MKKLILSTLYITIISFGFSQDFKINSSESIVEFNYLSEEAVGTIKGVFGTIHFDINNLSESYFEAKVNISSINTSNKTRDKHLNAPDYFHTEKYPHLIFKSESLKMEESEFVLVGNLTIKEISKNEYKIYSLGYDMKNILIFIISKKNTNAILIDEIKSGKAPEIISDVVDLGEENFLLTFIKEPSVGLLSFFKKKN